MPPDNQINGVYYKAVEVCMQQMDPDFLGLYEDRAKVIYGNEFKANERLSHDIALFTKTSWKIIRQCTTTIYSDGKRRKKMIFKVSNNSMNSESSLLNSYYSYSIKLPEPKYSYKKPKPNLWIDLNSMEPIVQEERIQPQCSLNYYDRERKSYDFTLKAMSLLLQKNKDRKIYFIEIGGFDGTRIFEHLENQAQKMNLDLTVISIEQDFLSSIIFNRKLCQSKHLNGVVYPFGLHNDTSANAGEIIGQYIEADAKVIISSRSSTDPYIEHQSLGSFVRPFVDQVVGCIAFEIEAALLLPPKQRIQKCKKIHDIYNFTIHPPLNASRSKLDDYFNIKLNRKPTSFWLHRAIQSKNTNLSHTCSIPIQRLYQHIGYYSLLETKSNRIII